MKVKVILQTDVAGLGEVGDVKEVAGGYARNYLIPRRLVTPATKGNLKVLEQRRSQIEQQQVQRRSEAQSLADRLAGLTLTFPVRVGEQGRLYGSVTAQDVAARLKSEAGVDVDRRVIELREPLRTLGQFDVSVRVAHAVTAHLKVVLRDQNAPVEAPQPAEATGQDEEASSAGTEEAGVAPEATVTE